MAESKSPFSSTPVAFIAIDQVQGESAVKDDQIDVLGWSWNLQQPADTRVEAGANGKAFANNLTFTKPVDKATPALLRYLLKCTHLKTAVLSTIKTLDGQMIDTYKLTMSNVVIAEMGPGLVDDNGRACEQIELNFDKFIIEYNQIKGGVAQGGVKYGWDLRKNVEYSE